MKEVSNADYDQIKRILRSLTRYNSLTRLRKDETCRKARLLLRKFDRKDSTRIEG